MHPCQWRRSVASAEAERHPGNHFVVCIFPLRGAWHGNYLKRSTGPVQAGDKERCRFIRFGGCAGGKEDIHDDD